MVNDVIVKLASAFHNISQMFYDIMDAVDGVKVHTTAIIVFMSYRFILKPIFGYAGSDLAKHSYNAFKRRKEK